MSQNQKRFMALHYQNRAKFSTPGFIDGCENIPRWYHNNIDFRHYHFEMRRPS